MSKDNKILLSFIVVTHNHENCIRRCLDSILSQEITFPYEIVAGDDNSSDHTWRILQEYEQKHPDLFVIYHVNSDDCSPLSLSDRASYNRGNAYKLIKGKYYAEVDGDDFLLPGDTYQKQVELLEAHPECWLCMQNMAIVEAGSSLATAKKRFTEDQLTDGRIITADYYISHPELFSQHQSFVFRRNLDNSPIDLLGLDYEDTTVTLFHLQFGSIIYIDKTGYQYISYPKGINRLLDKDDRLVSLALLQLEHMLFFPGFSNVILKASMPEIIHLLKIVEERELKVSSETRKSFSRYEGFVFRYFEKERHNILESLRIVVIRYLLLTMNKCQLTSNGWLRLAKRMLL